ncbi:hypothetical protein K7H13_13760 [Qipengyuania citrea]|uniref:DUF6950 family protein n=1 Tax=Qipengyuania citrea TaxID=225971 RepID=UPI001E45C52B|nr:hypothetical protein [Qipengyuania citrea]MCD1591815.1 hypothetical protein [Qipengyuania citrea]
MKKLTRYPDWTDRLACYLDRVRDEPFGWGEHDCVLFCNGAVKAITGKDFVSKYAGQYTDKREAALLLREIKAGTLKSAVTKKLGKPVHVAQAGKGDIVLRNKAIGVCVGRFTYFVGEQTVDFNYEGFPITKDGLVTWPTLDCDCAWKIAPTAILDAPIGGASGG